MIILARINFSYALTIHPLPPVLETKLYESVLVRSLSSVSTAIESFLSKVLSKRTFGPTLARKHSSAGSVIGNLLWAECSEKTHSESQTHTIVRNLSSVGTCTVIPTETFPVCMYCDSN